MLNLCRQRISIRIPNLCKPGRVVDRNDLIARLDFSNHFKLRRNIGYVLRAYRIPVTGGAREGWKIAICDKRFGEYASCSGEKIDRLLFSGRNSSGLLLDDMPGFFEGHDAS